MPSTGCGQPALQLARGWGGAALLGAEPVPWGSRALSGPTGSEPSSLSGARLLSLNAGWGGPHLVSAVWCGGCPRVMDTRRKCVFPAQAAQSSVFTRLFTAAPTGGRACPAPSWGMGWDPSHRGPHTGSPRAAVWRHAWSGQVYACSPARDFLFPWRAP